MLEKAKQERCVVAGLVVGDLQQDPEASIYGGKAASVSARRPTVRYLKTG